MNIKFEDVLKEYDEWMRQREGYAEAHKDLVDANMCRLVLERHPNADPNMTVRELVTEAELVEILREAEAMTEAFMKSKIEEGAREVYRRLVTVAGSTSTKQ